jgi:hypothetical protein
MGTRLPAAPSRRTGYDPRATTVIPASGATHAANPNGGLLCGRPPPTSAQAYDPENPTCADCADWLSKTRAHTDRIYGPTGILAQRAAAAAAAAAGPDDPEPPKE